MFRILTVVITSYLVPMKVLNNEKPKRPGEVSDTLWNLNCYEPL